MFQTHINRFLQQFDAAWWTAFMQTISDMGTRSFYIFIMLIILFCLEYRKGFLALQALLWANLFTVWLKEWLNMPRPYHVDADLKVFDFVTEEVRIRNGAAPSFFSAIPQESLDKIWAGPEIDNGFPSGHTSTSSAFYGTIALTFKKNWLTISFIFFVLLTILSRLYLGMHFLADILGGITLGLIPIIVIYILLMKGNKFDSWKALELIKSKLWILMLLAPLPLLLLPQAPVSIIAQIVGLNLAVAITCRKGFPKSEAVWWKRVLRLLIAIGLFMAITYLMGRFIPKSEDDLVSFFTTMIQFLIFFGLSTWLNLKLNLFEGRLVQNQ